MPRLIIETDTIYNEDGEIQSPGKWWYVAPDGAESDRFDDREQCFPDAYEKYPGLAIW